MIFKLPYATLKNDATVTVPGSKSYTNRALIIGALTKGTVTIQAPLVSDDTNAMISCLRKLGIKIEVTKDQYIVYGDISDIPNDQIIVDARLSGTTMRFLLALAAIVPADITLTGSGSLLKRPIKDMVDCLTAAGADIEYLDKVGVPPVRVRSGHLLSKKLIITGSTSSQFISALLMIAPSINGLSLSVTGDVISRPYIDMTIDIMSKFGIDCSNSHYRQFTIFKNSEYTPIKYEVEGDMSSASYFFAFAALAERSITVSNVKSNSKQADIAFLDVLEMFDTTFTKGRLDIKATGHGVIPIDVNMENFPDQAMTLAVLSAFSGGTSHITGIRSLRIKETERVKALQTELKNMGIETNSTEDTITILPGKPHAARISTYNDHRIAMSFSLASARIPHMEIENPEVVNKTFPGFWQQFFTLSDRCIDATSNVVLVGLRGSGKSTIAKILASECDSEYLDTDLEIARQHGNDIKEIITAKGWEKFRSLESKTVHRIAESSKRNIIATGGGVVLDKGNMDKLVANGLIVWLRAPAQILEERLRNSYQRAPLTSQKTMLDEIYQIMDERNKLYQEYADVIIDTEELSPKMVADEILLAMELLTS